MFDCNDSNYDVSSKCDVYLAGQDVNVSASPCPHIYLRYHTNVSDPPTLCQRGPSNTNKSGLKLHLLPCSIRHRSKPFYRSSSHLDVFTLQLFISHHAADMQLGDI